MKEILQLTCSLTDYFRYHTSSHKMSIGEIDFFCRRIKSKTEVDLTIIYGFKSSDARNEQNKARECEM